MSDDTKGPFDGLDFDVLYPEIPADVHEVVTLGSRLWEMQVADDEFLQEVLRDDSAEPRQTLAENCFCLGFLTFYHNLKRFHEGGHDGNVH